MHASQKSKEDTESTEKARLAQNIMPPSAFADQGQGRKIGIENQ